MCCGRDVMNRLAAALEGAGAPQGWKGARYVRIEGATDPRDRQQAVKRFRDDPAIRVALLSVTAAGGGPSARAPSNIVTCCTPSSCFYMIR